MDFRNTPVSFWTTGGSTTQTSTLSRPGSETEREWQSRFQISSSPAKNQQVDSSGNIKLVDLDHALGQHKQWHGGLDATTSLPDQTSAEKRELFWELDAEGVVDTSLPAHAGASLSSSSFAGPSSVKGVESLSTAFTLNSMQQVIRAGGQQGLQPHRAALRLFPEPYQIRSNLDCNSSLAAAMPQSSQPLWKPSMSQMSNTANTNQQQSALPCRQGSPLSLESSLSSGSIPLQNPTTPQVPQNGQLAMTPVDGHHQLSIDSGSSSAEAGVGGLQSHRPFPPIYSDPAQQTTLLPSQEALQWPTAPMSRIFTPEASEEEGIRWNSFELPIFHRDKLIQAEAGSTSEDPFQLSWHRQRSLSFPPGYSHHSNSTGNSNIGLQAQSTLPFYNRDGYLVTQFNNPITSRYRTSSLNEPLTVSAASSSPSRYHPCSAPPAPPSLFTQSMRHAPGTAFGFGEPTLLFSEHRPSGQQPWSLSTSGLQPPFTNSYVPEQYVKKDERRSSSTDLRIGEERKRTWVRAANGQFASPNRPPESLFSSEHGGGLNGFPSLRKIRKRKKYEEVDRKYACDFPGCDKAYGTLNHLNTHRAVNDHGPRLNAAAYRAVQARRVSASDSSQSPLGGSRST